MYKNGVRGSYREFVGPVRELGDADFARKEVGDEVHAAPDTVW